ncbi:MAG: hypothetical protein NUV47_03610 [Patescibacteria group bacterium]|nr:hypothetical protein [Patescibacteria group bacterium]
MNEYAGKIAGIISFLSVIIYVVSIFKGNTKPNKVTWWIMTFVGGMILVSYFTEMKSENKDTIWIPITYVINPLIIALFSIKYGEKSDRKSFETDILCFKISITSIILWGILIYLKIGVATLVILIINLLSDFVGLYPTVIKSILRPESEGRWGWMLATIASIINIFAISEWAFSESVYQVYIVTLNGYITFLLFRKQKR